MGNEKTGSQLFEDRLLKKIDAVFADQTEEIKSTLQDFKTEIREEIHIYNRKISELEIEHLTLQKRYHQLERAVKKYNLVFFGLKVDSGNILESLVSELNNLLSIDLTGLDIRDVYQLKKQGNKVPPVKVEFNSFFKKQLVLKNSKKLKGTDIYVSHDLCEEDRAKNRFLVQHMKVAKNRKCKAIIRGDKLIIDGKSYTVDQLRDLHRCESTASESEDPHSGPSAPNLHNREKALEGEFGLPKLALEYVPLTNQAIGIGRETGAVRRQKNNGNISPVFNNTYGSSKAKKTNSSAVDDKGYSHKSRSNSVSSGDRAVTRAHQRGKPN